MPLSFPKAVRLPNRAIRFEWMTSCTFWIQLKFEHCEAFLFVNTPCAESCAWTHQNILLLRVPCLRVEISRGSCEGSLELFDDREHDQNVATGKGPTFGTYPSAKW